MVAVAHQVEHRIVAPEVAGSRPVSHPTFLFPVLAGEGTAFELRCLRAEFKSGAEAPWVYWFAAGDSLNKPPSGWLLHPYLQQLHKDD